MQAPQCAQCGQRGPQRPGRLTLPLFLATASSRAWNEAKFLRWHQNPVRTCPSQLPPTVQHSPGSLLPSSRPSSLNILSASPSPCLPAEVAAARPLLGAAPATFLGSMLTRRLQSPLACRVLSCVCGLTCSSSTLMLRSETGDQEELGKRGPEPQQVIPVNRRPHLCRNTAACCHNHLSSQKCCVMLA